jgi:hypothetical protein
MIKKIYFKHFLSVLILAFLFLYSCQSQKKQMPNIIFILADDMGYGDVNFLNDSSKIATPNLDKLAGEGMYFTDAHSGSAVCTPHALWNSYRKVCMAIQVTKRCIVGLG